MSGGLAALRVLLLDSNKHLRQVLPPLLAGAGIRDLFYGLDYKNATFLLTQRAPHLVVLDFDAAPAEALEFIRAARQPGAAWNFKLPIIMLVSQPERDQIWAARDAGVNEILVKPVTTVAVMDRLSRVILKPRPFIACDTYCGPDRRRKTDPNYRGPSRRRIQGTTDLIH